MERERRTDRRAAYDRLRAERPHLFDNPPGAAYEILLDQSCQDAVADEAARAVRERGIPTEHADIGIVYEDPYILVVRDAVRFPAGNRGAYVRVVGARSGVGAAVLPVLSDGRLLLVHHFRHADRRWHWEIPRGFGEPGADGAATARREAEEELGCTVQTLVYLGAVNRNSGMDADRDEVFLATIDVAVFDAALSDAAAEEGIDEVRAVEPGPFRSMMISGDITDAYTLSAYALAIARQLLP